RQDLPRLTRPEVRGPQVQTTLEASQVVEVLAILADQVPAQRGRVDREAHTPVPSPLEVQLQRLVGSRCAAAAIAVVRCVLAPGLATQLQFLLRELELIVGLLGEE